MSQSSYFDEFKRGWEKKGFLQGKYCISPPPLPTTDNISDDRNIIWRKTNSWLDVCSFSTVAGAAYLTFGILITILIAIFTSSWIFLGIMLIAFLPSVYYQIIWYYKKPVPIPLRFNRERREVFIPQQEDGSYWLVPWETVIAVVQETHSYGQTGKIGMAFLTLGFPYPENTPNENRIFKFSVACGSEKNCEAQWECIRTFMEGDPNLVSNGILADLNEPLTKFLKEQFKEKGFGVGLWELTKIIIFGACWSIPLERKKMAKLPSIPPEIEEWSKPIPEEQWAKRSPELQQAFDEYYAEQAAKQDNGE